LQPTQAEKGAAFRALHEGATFVIPNPWDAGSAKLLETMGFRALATTSSGLAFTLARRDGGATLADVADHVRLLCSVTALPVSVDLENGYGPAREDAAAAIAAAADAGAVGGSIEDYDPSEGIYELDRAVDRVAAACDEARALPFPFLVTARAENHIRGNPDLDDTIARLRAFADAGADVLYAPGLATLDEIRAVCASTSTPVNVLARPNLTLRELRDAGVRRVSVGGALAWASVNAAARAAEAIRDDGDFSQLGSSARIAEWL
jgi:2-methylisocitrate lyase-like PEP mutase family enzyme